VVQKQKEKQSVSEVSPSVFTSFSFSALSHLPFKEHFSF
jgi:hypothetical protein